MTYRPTLPWGKFRGVPLDQVPRQYLFWCHDNAERLSPHLKAAIAEELGFGQEAPPYRPPPPPPPPSAPAELVRAAVARWLREATLRWHPDKGGDVRVMAALNDLRERLEGTLRTLEYSQRR